MTTTPGKSTTYPFPILKVLVRGESRSERKAYGSQRIEEAAQARRHRGGGATAAGGPFPLPAGIQPTPAHDLVNQGGKTIAALQYKNIYVSGDTVWSASDKQNIDTFLQAIMTEPKLVHIVQQYFPGGSLSTTFHGSADLAIPAPTTVSRGDIDALVQQALTANLIQGDLDATVFNFLLPPGTVLTDDAAPSGGAAAPSPPVAAVKTEETDEKASSLEGLGGYHGSVHVGGQRFYFAVGVYSQNVAGGQQNGIVAFNQPWKNVVATFYHELQEARTDADVEDVNNRVSGAQLGWISAQGEEIGDFPVFEDPNLTGVFVEIPLTAGDTAPVQLIYSNRAHGPEVPQ
jgi:hypothetical protein